MATKLIATLYVGTGFDKNGKEITNKEQRKEALQDVLADKFGGYSVAPVEGGWHNERGELVTEESLRFEIVVTDTRATRDNLKEAAAIARDYFNQEAVLLAAGPQGGDL